MPIYEYQCQACDHRLEALQRLSEPPLTTCPECSGELRKLVSAPAFQFKGSGWYVTDYARKGGKSDEGSKGGGESKNGSGTTGDAAKGKDTDKPKAPAKAAGPATS